MQEEKKVSNSIKNWSSDEQPREKLVAHGANVLSNAELLAILILNGSGNKSAIDLAKEILAMSENNLDELGRLSLKDFQKVKGIGIAKAVTIAAALELGKRRQNTDFLQRKIIRNSRDIHDYLQNHIRDLDHEVFMVMFLNQSNRILHTEMMSKGGITGTVVDVRIILKKALELKSTCLVLSHNHPSGVLKPSRADEQITEKIKSAASLLDIRILDHLIVSNEGFYSFADEGLI